MDRNTDALGQWSQIAPYWEKHRNAIHTMYAPITRALIEATEIQPGNWVLDVATGPGEPALSIAVAVGSSGGVVGIDPVPEMIAAARRAAERDQFKNVRFEISSVESLPFPADTFDAVVSRFGVMFFPAPIDGVREMLRVLRPNQRIGFAVWSFPERNPYHYVLADVMDRYVHSEPVGPDAPDAFRFAAPGKLLNILNEAGAARTGERLLQFDIEAPLSAEDFWMLRSDMSDRLRARRMNISPEIMAAIRRDVIHELRAYSTSRGICFPAEVLVVRGTKV